MNIAAESRIELNTACNAVDLYSIRHKRKLHEKNASKLRLGIPIKLTANCIKAESMKPIWVIFLFLLYGNFSEKYIREIKASKKYVNR